MKLAVALLLASVAMQAQFVRRAPGFSLPDVNFKQYDLADYRGKVVLIDIIQTTCPKCQELTRSLTEIKAKYADKVQVLTIVMSPDNDATIKAYVERFGVRSPILIDCGQMIGSYLNLTPSNSTVHFPHLFVIDKVGMIRGDLDETQVSLTSIVGAIESAMK